MKIALALLLLLASAKAHGEHWVYNEKDIKVRLTSDACTMQNVNEVLITVATPPKVALIIHRGFDISACWVITEDLVVMIMDAYGDKYGMSAHKFKYDPGI